MLPKEVDGEIPEVEFNYMHLLSVEQRRDFSKAFTLLLGGRRAQGMAEMGNADAEALG